MTHPVLTYNEHDHTATLLGVEMEQLPGGYSYRQHGPRETEHGRYRLVWTTRLGLREALNVAERLGHTCPTLRVHLGSKSRAA